MPKHTLVVVYFDRDDYQYKQPPVRIALNPDFKPNTFVDSSNVLHVKDLKDVWHCIPLINVKEYRFEQ